MPEVPAHEKVLVGAAFLEDENHGKAGCQSCHGGNPQGATRKLAHAGMTADPTASAAAQTCGSAACHPSEVASNAQSFHTTLEGIRDSMVRRSGLDPLTGPVQTGFNNHCTSCHSTCGNCHVSVPAPAKGGLLDRHSFKKTPPMVLVCTACHGSRVNDEYTGLNHLPDGGVVPPDVHYSKGMQCVACHKKAEMHGEGQAGLKNRYQVPNAPKCQDCHPTDQAPFTSVLAHTINEHKDSATGALDLSCQVCHSNTYKSCYSCHVSVKDGKPTYVVNEANNFESRLDFKIGFNPQRDALHPEKWVTLRHTTGDPDNFQFYGPNLLPAFDSGGPTWRLATPHNVRKVSPQASGCTTTCHNNRSLFLAPADLLPYEVNANQGVVVPDADIPK